MRAKALRARAAGANCIVIRTNKKMHICIQNNQNAAPAIDRRKRRKQRIRTVKTGEGSCPILPRISRKKHRVCVENPARFARCNSAADACRNTWTAFPVRLRREHGASSNGPPAAAFFVAASSKKLTSAAAFPAAAATGQWAVSPAFPASDLS